MKLFGIRLPGMSSLLIWGLLWEIVGRLEISFFVPPLSAVMTTLFEVIGHRHFKRHCTKPPMRFVRGFSLPLPSAFLLAY